MTKKELCVPDEVSHVLRSGGEAVYKYEALHVPFAKDTIIHLVRHIEELPGNGESMGMKKPPEAVIYRRYEREIPGRLIHREDGAAFYLFHEEGRGAVIMVEIGKTGVEARSVSPMLTNLSNFLSFFVFSKRETNRFLNKTERRGWRFAPFVPFAKTGLSVIWNTTGKRTSTLIEERVFSEDTDIEDFDFHSCVSAYHPELRRGVFFTRKGNSPMVLYGENGVMKVFPDTFGIVPSVKGDYLWRAESDTENKTMRLEKIDLDTGETVDEILMRNLPIYVLHSARPSRITEDGKRIALAEKSANSHYPKFYILHDRETEGTVILSQERENYDSRYYLLGRHLGKAGVFRYPDISLSASEKKYASEFLYAEKGELRVVHFDEKGILLLPYLNDDVETAFAEFAAEKPASFAERVCEGFYLLGYEKNLVLLDTRKRAHRIVGTGKSELSGITRVYPGPGGENYSSSVPYAEDGEPYYVPPKDIHDPSNFPRRIFYEVESDDGVYGAVIYRVPDENAFGALLPDGLRVSPNAVRHSSFLFEIRGDNALIMDFCEDENGALVLFSMRVDMRSGDVETGDFVETGIPYDSSVTVVGEGAVSIGEIMEDGKTRYTIAAFFDGNGKLRTERTQEIVFEDYEAGKKKIYPVKTGPDACTLIYEKEEQTCKLRISGETLEGPFELSRSLERIVNTPYSRLLTLWSERDPAINVKKTILTRREID